MKALVVEDEAEVVETIILCLSMPWPDVTLIATNSGEVAVEVTRWLAPDVILLDLQVNDMYGLQTLQQIRAFSEVPLIVVTANNQEISRHRAMELGANDYLVKPFTHIDLLGSLKSVLGQTYHWTPGSIDGQPNGGLIINIPGRQVSRHGDAIDLNPAEWRLLTAVINAKNGAVPRPVKGMNAKSTADMTPAAAARAYRTLTTKLGLSAPGTGLLLSHNDQGYRFVSAN